MFAFFIVLGSSSVFVTTSTSRYVYLSIIVSGFLLLFFSWGAEKENFKKISKSHFGFFLIIYIIFIVHFVLFSIHITSTRTYLMQFVSLFLLFFPIIWFYISLYGYKDLLTAFVNVVVVISVISIVFWLLGSILHILSPSGQVESSWGTTRYFPSYHSLYFETQNGTVFGNVFVRNSGIWPEAPMFAMVLTFSWISELFMLKRHKKLIISILIIALISTLTSTAYVILVLTFFIKFIPVVTHRKTVFPLFIFIVALIVFAVPIFGVLMQSINAKMTSLSGSIRIDDYLAAGKSWKHALIFGHGYSNYSYISQFMDLGVRQEYYNGRLFYNQGLANSWSQIVSDGGALFLLIYSVPFIQNTMSKRYSANRRLAFMMIIILMFFSVLCYTTILFVFLAIAIAQTDDLENKERVNLDTK